MITSVLSEGMRVFLLAFGVVLVSEMGDKTQITTMLLAGAKPAHVFWVGLGSTLALSCASFIEVIVGSKIIARLIKPETVRIVTGIVFVLLGLLLVSGIMGNVQDLGATWKVGV